MNPFKIGDEVVRKPEALNRGFWKGLLETYPRRVFTVIGVSDEGIQLVNPYTPVFYCGNFEFAHKPPSLEEML